MLSSTTTRYYHTEEAGIVRRQVSPAVNMVASIATAMVVIVLFGSELQVLAQHLKSVVPVVKSQTVAPYNINEFSRAKDNGALVGSNTVPTAQGMSSPVEPKIVSTPRLTPRRATLGVVQDPRAMNSAR